MGAITDISQLDRSRLYTYADYLTWQVRDRIELIMGRIFTMSPAPSSEHQRVVSVLQGNFYYQLKHSYCQVFPAPFDVVLPSLSGELNTVVQPDITVVCDATKITNKGCFGSPDLVVEVVSSSSLKKDLHEKYALYEQHGVKEYWLVFPADRSLVIFRLNDHGVYQAGKPLTSGDSAISHALQDVIVDLAEIFPDVVEEAEEGYWHEVNRI